MRPLAVFFAALLLAMGVSAGTQGDARTSAVFGNATTSAVRAADSHARARGTAQIAHGAVVTPTELTVERSQRRANGVPIDFAALAARAELPCAAQPHGSPRRRGRDGQPDGVARRGYQATGPPTPLMQIRTRPFQLAVLS